MDAISEFFAMLMGGGGDTSDKYKAIHKLHEMLDEAGIPHKFCRQMDGYQVVYYGGPVPEPTPGAGNAWGSKGDAIEHSYSYDNENDLLEVAGCLSREDDPRRSGLTAEEVFRRIKEDYENINK